MEGKIPSSPRVWIFIIQVKHAKLTVPPADLLKQKRLTFMGIFRRASCLVWASQVTLVVRNQPTNAGDIRDTGSIHGSRRVPGGGNGNPLQYSCLENPMGREAWRAIVHGITELDTTEMNGHARTQAWFSPLSSASWNFNFQQGVLNFHFVFGLAN